MADALQAVDRKGFLPRYSRHKSVVFAFIVVLFVNKTYTFADSQPSSGITAQSSDCREGDSVNGTCVCFPGWSGGKCDQCSGRISLNASSGVVYDGSSGDYPTDRMCSWLLDTHSNQGNTSVRFVFSEFETECGWDHLYVHDGDSVFSPLLAAYSGMILSKEDDAPFEFNFRLSGRYGYLHFYSDAAYTMSGFNISYSVGGCYLNCSDRGLCVDGGCQCQTGWSGVGCETDLDLCRNNCSQNGLCTAGVCACDQGYRGDDCSVTDNQDVWERLVTSSPPSGRASHNALLREDAMWVVGGFSLSDVRITLASSQRNNLLRYDIASRTWSAVTEAGDVADHPWPLYAHSTVWFENKLYVHGGVRNGQVSEELWVFDVATGNWSRLQDSAYPVSGHSAHVVNRSMLVFFGYSPTFGYLNHIIEYSFDSGEWSRVQTTGSRVYGGYGHASVYQQAAGKVFVSGGYHSHSESSTSSSSTYNLTDMLYVYDVSTREWLILLSSGHPRYLHSMVVRGNHLLVFGGNTHNDTSKSQGAKCFSKEFMLYDIQCNTWQSMASPQLAGSSRFGHSMVVHNDSLIMFGGFDSLMLNDVVQVKLGTCEGITNETECLSAAPGIRCVWDQGICRQQAATDQCQTGDSDVCPGYNTCTACVSADCTWCGNNCTSLNCTAPIQVSNVSLCETDDLGCGLHHTCQACQSDALCLWSQSRCQLNTNPLPEGNNASSNVSQKLSVCTSAPCRAADSCGACTQSNCMWCSNLQLCIDTNAYVASFPYGQCMDWTTKAAKCEATTCEGRKSCGDCLSNSKCGWCRGPHDNGLGTCRDGGVEGARQTGNQTQCPAGAWFFTECPLCLCNGHATCASDSSVCQSCRFPTDGQNCQNCQHFYYGSPVNGGNCSECQCNGQADSCNQHDGKCNCHTRGIKGNLCDKCDDVNKYFGDPKNGGTCYYSLSTDYQYTFNLSKDEDANYTQINFLSIPQSGDKDVDFTLNCSGLALINITFKARNQAEEQVITSLHECDYFRTKFEHKDYSFGGDSNSTFFVYVYAFKTPFWLQISFSQFPKIDLVHFFITFFSCFLSLLLIAAALWKIKHKYDSYRRRQQLMVEMQAMASRPFSSVCVEVERKTDPPSGGVGPPERKELKDHVDTALRRRKKLANKPSAIAIEPTAGNKAAVLTLLVQLPFGDADYAPSGQSGMAVGSALVSIGQSGTTRKQSLEHIKGDKSKVRKHLVYSHPDAMA